MIKHRNHSGFLVTEQMKKVTERARRAVVWGLLVAALGAGTMPVHAQELDKKPTNEVERREKLHQIRMRQIPLLEQFLTKYKGSPREADSLFRLAEAHYETGKYFEAMGNKGEADRHNAKATQILEGLRVGHGNYQRLDEALFVLANSYIEARDMTKAGAVLSEIAQRYPESPILKQASLLLGDYHFEKQEFPKAETYYRKAAEDPKIQSYVYYKLAWVSMNLSQPARALQWFEKVLELRASGQAQNSDYTKEAAREMIFAALEVHKSKGIVAYLQRILNDPELIKLSLGTLARGLVQRSDFSGASDIYGILTEQYPASPEMNEWVSAQLKAEEALGRTSKIGSLVAKLNTAGADSPKVQSQVFNSAKKFHAEGQKATLAQEKNRLFDLAIGYYQAFLQGQASPELTAQVHFYLGEVMYSRGRLPEARTEYEISAQLKSDVQSRAAWNWFLTAEKIADGFRYQGKTLQATTASDEEYLRAAQAIQQIPGITIDQKRRASYQSARLLYQLNDLERALPIFQYMAQNHGGTQEGKLSAQLVLDIYNMRKDYKNVAQYAKAYQASATDSGTRAELGQLEQKALIKTIQEEENAAKNASGEEKLQALNSVANRYMDFARNYPHSNFVDAALWSATQNYAFVAAEKNDRGEVYSSLKSSFELLSSKYANSSFAPKAIALMGKFLSQRKVGTKELQGFSRYRHLWANQMKSEPLSSRGLMAMMIFKMSSESEKRALIKDFASYPRTDDNKEPYAYVQLEKVKALRDKLDAVSLSNLKTLKKNTQIKMDMLDRLQTEVAALLKLQVAAPALDALKVLGDGNMKVAKALRSAPIPKGLVGENIAKYKEIVAGAAQDLEVKGQEAYRLADEKTKEIDWSAI